MSDLTDVNLTSCISLSVSVVDNVTGLVRLVEANFHSRVLL